MANEAIMGNETALNHIKLFSAGSADFAMRMGAYTKAMAQTAVMEDIALSQGAHRRVMNFAAAGPGMAAANLRGTTIYPATIMSYISNIAPIFAVERFMDTPEMDAQFMDFYNLATSDVILPNLGQDKPFGDNVISNKDITSAVAGADGGSYTAAGALVPRTIEIKYVLNDGTTKTIVDNGNGVLWGEPGLLAKGSVNYSTGVVEIKFAQTPAGTTKIFFTGGLDTPSEGSVDKIGGQSKYYHLSTEPIIVPLQRNIIADAAMNKQGVIDPNELYTNVIQSQYTKIMNEKVAGAVVNHYDGDTFTADLSGFGLAAGNYDSFIRTFQSLMVDGGSQLEHQTYKGGKVTGILAGAQVSNTFQYMTEQEGWVPNTQLGYFKDLIGWYKGVAVVRWTAHDSDSVKVADDEIYLTHKTVDGQLAPAMRGTFITPTDLPEIANFQNSTQLSSGMFSLEGVRPTTSKLVVKMKITLPSSQVLHKQ